ncbi:hypothetical protein M0804_011678 [Polistes exclamans]|nr:hypothetical protein M0804_011678 [Polistes exclamans]
MGGRPSRVIEQEEEIEEEEEEEEDENDLMMVDDPSQGSESCRKFRSVRRPLEKVDVDAVEYINEQDEEDEEDEDEDEEEEEEKEEEKGEGQRNPTRLNPPSNSDQPVA